MASAVMVFWAERAEKPCKLPGLWQLSGMTETELNPTVLELVRILSDRKPHKAKDLAFRLGVHSKTVRRWLHFMRDERKLPIRASRDGFFVE